MKVLGLTGPIGAGKSAAAAALKSLGAVTVDADAIVHRLLTEPRLIRAMVRRWGPEVAPRGRLDRRAVAVRVFRDDTERRFLERMVHPPVLKAIEQAVRRACKAGEKFAVIDAPLLVETGLHKLCDAVLYIDAPRRERLRRARQAKGFSACEVSRRERAMAPLGVKRKLADRVIRNDGDRKAMARKLERFLKKL